MTSQEKEILVGEVTHYFTAIGVGIIKVKKSFKKGSRLHFKGANTDFYQEAVSMQLNHKDISEAPCGEMIGIKVEERVREGDKVFLVVSKKETARKEAKRKTTSKKKEKKKASKKMKTRKTKAQRGSKKRSKKSKPLSKKISRRKSKNRK